MLKVEIQIKITMLFQDLSNWNWCLKRCREKIIRYKATTSSAALGAVDEMLNVSQKASSK